MLVHARIDSIISKASFPNLQLHPKKRTALSGKNMSEESAPICESDVFVFDKEISKFSHKLDKEGMVRSSSPRRKIPERFAH